MDIPLTGLGGKFVATIDDEDYALISKYKWFASRGGRKVYARANVRTGKGSFQRVCVFMHRLILPDVPVIDHRDGNGLNNCRDNLRPSTHASNAWNSDKRTASTSPFKGVRLLSGRNRRKPWRACITKNGKEEHVGCFATAEEAARAYDQAASKLFGEYARPNL